MSPSSFWMNRKPGHQNIVKFNTCRAVRRRCDNEGYRMALTSSPVGSDSWNRSIVIRQKTSLFLMCIRRRLKVGSKNEKDLHQLFEKIVHYPECGGWAQPLLKPVYGGRTVYKEMTNGAQGWGGAGR